MENNLYILGVKINKVSFAQAVKQVEKFISGSGKYFIVTPYSESIVAAVKDSDFRRIVNEAALSVPDGGGLLAAAEYLSYELPAKGMARIIVSLAGALLVGLKLVFFRRGFRVLKEPVPGIDLFGSLCGLASKQGLKVYLLGGELPDVAKRTAAVLKSMFPALQVEADSGPLNLKQATEAERLIIIRKINEYAPDFLFVAFKPVEQEKWLAANMGAIKARVFMAVGGAFDMISGYKRRAPLFVRSIGLEWLWRLIIEPSRVGRVYNAIIVFPLMVFREKLRTG